MFQTQFSVAFCHGTGISVPAGSSIDWPILSSSLQVCAAISCLLHQTGPSPHPLLLDTPEAFCLLSTYYLHISHIICLLVKYYTDIKCRLQKLKNILDAYCILNLLGHKKAPTVWRGLSAFKYGVVLISIYHFTSFRTPKSNAAMYRM